MGSRLFSFSSFIRPSFFANEVSVSRNLLKFEKIQNNYLVSKHFYWSTPASHFTNVYSNQINRSTCYCQPLAPTTFPAFTACNILTTRHKSRMAKHKNQIMSRTGKQPKNVAADDEKADESDDEEDEEDYDEQTDDESDDEEEEKTFDQDKVLSSKPKDIKVFLKSLRLDSIVAAGFNVSRNSAADYFLDSRLRLNGERVLKKSVQMAVGDFIDLVSEDTLEISKSGDKGVKVKRVRILSVESDKRRDNTVTVPVRLRVWRANNLLK